MKKRMSQILCLLLACVFVLAGCGSGGDSGNGGAAVDTSKVRVEISSDPSVLCGGFAANSTVNLVSDQVFDTLITSNRDGTYNPSLATEWEFTEDNKDIIFTIRDDVKFHDGTTMTADDVVFSLNEVINGGFASTSTSAMDYAEKIDDTHVRLNFKMVYGPALETVATSYMTIFPKAYYEKDPDFFKRNPIGTGPYKFVSWESGASIQLTRNDDYFGGAAPIKDIEFKVYIDSNTAAIALENNEIDVLTSPLQTDRQRLMDNENLVYNECDSAQVTWAFFNCGDGKFTNKRLREAVSYAVDRAAVMMGAVEGVGYEVNSMYPNFLPYSYNDYQIVHPYDPEMANQILDEEGWVMNDSTGIREKDGVPFTLDVKTRESSNYYMPLEIIQSQLKAVGIDMKLTKMESSAWFDNVLRAGDFEFNMISTTLGFFDFDERYALFVSGQEQNYYQVADENLDAAFDTNRSSTDPAAREQACHDIIRIMDEEAYILPLFGNMRGICYNKNLQGVQADPQYIYHINTWSWADQAAAE